MIINLIKFLYNYKVSIKSAACQTNFDEVSETIQAKINYMLLFKSLKGTLLTGIKNQDDASKTH